MVSVDGLDENDAMYDITDSWIFMGGTVHKIIQSGLPNGGECGSEVCKRCSGIQAHNGTIRV